MLDTSLVSCVNRQRLQAISILLANDPSLLRLIFRTDRERLSAEPEVLLELSSQLSTGQQILVRVALDIWSGEGHAKLWDIVTGLDVVRFEGFMLALECLRYWRPAVSNS